MSYESWRISFQDSEQAARAAYEAFQMNNDRSNGLIDHLEEVMAERDSLKAHAVAVAAAVGYDENSAYQFDASMQVHCINNVKGFAEQLHAIEREFFMVPGEPDEDYPDDEPDDECLVNCWGSTTEQYVEQFRAALARRAALNQSEGMKKAALLIEQKADAYNDEHGTTDPSTGSREYPGDGAEYYNNLMELAEELYKQAEGHQ
ncbi:hypothetical protein [Vreelandella boliviensis]|uniref:hypothetical protein n=1 Tax=Vreelandella boliviensis TaxID=223527 RepID=UPI001B8BE1FF|nr:hypothetical protein [Halomonas boliviensis]MBS3670157.1 hypothetical protein [Halomonas boliviensis]